MIHPIILASASPRRKQLLESIGLKFQIDPSDADESYPEGMQPREIVQMLALRKAISVVDKYEEGLVIGSDTIVVIDGQVLGKPADETEACRMLSLLQGRTHQVYSGIAIVLANASAGLESSPSDNDVETHLNPNTTYRIVRNEESGNRISILGYSMTSITFKPLSDVEIKGYVSKGESLDKAGAYAAQGVGSVLISNMEGDYFGVVGMPLSLLIEMLKPVGLNVLHSGT